MDCPHCGLNVFSELIAERPSHCPKCGGKRIVVHLENDETFYPRYGCLDCNVWLNKVRCR